ncbi:MAG: hypothetical protein LBF86_03745 [Helicobacteraceae bacterium]|jgi:hypothetical protein|nr:hypothetical protein [Helicobacteraceae bacterium]
MTGFDYAALLRRKLNDSEGEISDGEILDALNLGLLELGRELSYWRETYEFDANEDGQTALPDRFLSIIEARLNDKKLEIKSANYKPDERSIVIDGFFIKTLPTPPLLQLDPPVNASALPLRYTIEYITFAQIGDLHENVPIASSMSDLLIAYCVMQLKERYQGEKPLNEIKLWTELYQMKLANVRAKLRPLLIGKNLSTKQIIC